MRKIVIATQRVPKKVVKSTPSKTKKAAEPVKINLKKAAEAVIAGLKLSKNKTKQLLKDVEGNVSWLGMYHHGFGTAVRNQLRMADINQNPHQLDSIWPQVVVKALEILHGRKIKRAETDKTLLAERDTQLKLKQIKTLEAEIKTCEEKIEKNKAAIAKLKKETKQK